MATRQSVLTKTAVLGAALALAGLTSTSAEAQEVRADRAPAFVNLTVASASAPIYAKPTSSSTRYRSEPRGTTLRIACSTTATPSGNMWFRIYDSQPVAWVWSGHFPSLVHPPKKC
jgi:hypothetical protein